MIDKLKKIVEQNPGADQFVELAKMLSSSKQGRVEAREVCFRGLNENPGNLHGRLMLARLFYLDGLTQFCLRELLEIKKSVKLASLDRLISSISGYIEDKNQDGSPLNETNAGENSEIVAELDLEMDFSDLENEISK